MAKQNSSDQTSDFTVQVGHLYDTVALLESLETHLLDRDDNGRRLTALARERVQNVIDVLETA